MPDLQGPARPEQLPDRVRMPLLTLITQQALDEDYLDAAERRTAGTRAPQASRRRTALLVSAVIVLFGVLVSTAFVQTSRGADAASADRASLIKRVDGQRERVARQQQRSAALSARNTQLARNLTRTTSTEQALEGRNRRLQVSTGLVAVTGEGVRVTVTQAPSADSNQAVQDSDLALLVNALWTSGAEAISINGERLTAISAIRSSGPAILVNKRGIAPPYVVSAIGDRGTLQARFAESASGQQFIGLSTSFGFSYDMENVARLDLPAAPRTLVQLRSTTITGPQAPAPKSFDDAPEREEKQR